MPRKRRLAKRRAALPRAATDISASERITWSVYGPAIGDAWLDASGRVVPEAWPDWATWARVYAQVRDGLYGDRLWLRERSIAERLFDAWRAGHTELDGLRAALVAERDANDPRRALCRVG